MADSVKAVSEVLSTFKQKEGTAVQPKEFFWDQFLKYITSAILALTVVNISVEFLRGGGVSCFPPSDSLAIIREELAYEFGRGQTRYINNFCSRSIPITEYFPIYIIVHGLLLVVPHYVWSAIHNGDFDSFFAIVDKLDRLRNSSTGEYDAKNFDRVTKLELEYSGRKIFFAYILKLVLQLLICVGSIIFSIFFFVNFSSVFYCPESSAGDVVDGWPLNLTIPCVYTSLRILALVQYADFFLLGVALLLIVFGLFWCCVRHTAQLGSVQLAKFEFQSCLKSDFFLFPSIVSWPCYPCFKSRKSNSKAAQLVPKFWILTHYPKVHFGNLFSPRILHDLDFLLLMLFRADSSHGQVFKDIQINKELKRVVGRDHQLLHLYINIQQDLPRLSPPRTNETNEETQQESDEEKDCCGCLTRLFKRSRVNPQSTEDVANAGVTVEMESRPGDQTRGDQSLGNRALEGLHSIFHITEFNDDAERIAYDQFKPHLGQMKYSADYMKGIRNVLYCFVTKFGPRYPGTDQPPKLKNSLAMDISFGSIGYSLVLARPFITVFSVKFQPHYLNVSNEPGVLKEFYTNYVTFTYPSDLYSQSSESITGANKLILRYFKPEQKLDFIVVGPIMEESKLVSVNLLLNILYGQGRIGKEAILLAIRPLKFASHKVGQQFFKYEPSKLLFNHKYHEDKVTGNIPPEFKHYVDGVDGIRVDCGTTPCVFEMIAYQYHGEIRNPPSVTIPDLSQSSVPIPVASNAIPSSQAESREDIMSPTSIDSGNFSPTETALPLTVSDERSAGASIGSGRRVCSTSPQHNKNANNNGPIGVPNNSSSENDVI